MLPAPRAPLDLPVVAPSVGEPMGGKGSPPSGESCSPKGGVPGQDHKQASADPPQDEETAWSPEDWLKVPAIRKTPRVGWFFFNPSGPGYYTFLDLLRGEYRSEAPPAPFGLRALNVTPFYDRDFRFLDSPDNTNHLWTDAFKRVHLGDDFLFATGGEFRYRYNNYTNDKLSGKDNPYDLTRLRLGADFWYRDQVRVYVEMIDARTFNQNLPPGGSDATGTDLLNAFAELKLFDLADGRGYVRAGRQELVLGSERLVSSPDWSNTLRTYDGVRALYTSAKWDLDAFWVQPVVANPNRFDSSNNHLNFSGLWVTHKPIAGTAVEAYLLNLNNTVSQATQGSLWTIGGRYSGDVKKRLLFDFEGMTQTGDAGGKTANAQAATGGLGWNFADLPWNVSFWTYYDFASGTPDPKGSVDRTFNQLFPAGHTYFGYLDLVGRQNIHDLNFQLNANPQPWLSLLMQFHIFRLASAKDALYDSTGKAIRQDPTGAAGTDVGNEIDALVNFHLTSFQDVTIGYSQLFVGDFVRNTGSDRYTGLLYVLMTTRW